jgi:hypothetical protein
VVANPFVMGHLNTLYYRRALVSVRAMVDPNNDDDSRVTLLTGIALHPGDLEVTDSRCGCPAPTPSTRTKYAPTSSAFRPWPRQRRSTSTSGSRTSAVRAPPTVPNAPEIDAAVELIGELLHKYTLLPTGADLRLPRPVGAVVAGTQGARVRCCSDCCLSDVMTKIIERLTLIRRGSWSLTVKLQIAHMALALPLTRHGKL